MLQFAQDKIICDRRGRDCIEEAIGDSFNCSFSCEGLYADVQWSGAADRVESEEEKEWRRLIGRMDRDEEEMDKKKVLAMVEQYNRFKRGNIRHFRFASEESERIFGESLLIVKLCS